MEWFKGGVVNAISQCRQRRVLFVVYLKGTTLHTHILYISPPLSIIKSITNVFNLGSITWI